MGGKGKGFLEDFGMDGDISGMDIYVAWLGQVRLGSVRLDDLEGYIHLLVVIGRISRGFYCMKGFYILFWIVIFFRAYLRGF